MFLFLVFLLKLFFTADDPFFDTISSIDGDGDGAVSEDDFASVHGGNYFTLYK